MQHSTEKAPTPPGPAPLPLLLIGCLAMHGQMTMAAVLECADRVGASTEDAACEVSHLIDGGLIGAEREGTTGRLVAAPGLHKLGIGLLSRAVISYVASAKAVAHA